MTIYKQAMGKIKKNDISLEKTINEIVEGKDLSKDTMISINEDTNERIELNIKDLRNTYGDNFIWGVPNKSNNKVYFDKLKDGDIVFFARENFIVKIGEVSKKFISNDVSNIIWGTETWELIYLLKQVSEVYFPVELFNDTVGYDRSAFFRGLSVVKKNYTGRDLLLELSLTYPDYFFQEREVK
ncbi:MAG: hypothetical protein LBE23_10900 [Vagococcus sp.]|jgi:hypothetical protein|nr:hypothetical protein [Vagococcus sp.]